MGVSTGNFPVEISGGWKSRTVFVGVDLSKMQMLCSVCRRLANTSFIETISFNIYHINTIMCTFMSQP